MIRGLPAMLAISLRRARAEPGLAMTVVATVAVTCLLGAMLPRLEHRVTDDGIRHELRTSAPTLRSVQVLATGRIVAATDPADPMRAVREAGDDVRGDLGPTLREVLSPPTFVAESTRYQLVPDPDIRPVPPPSFLALRQQEEVNRHVRYVAGREPTGSGRTALLPLAGAGGATLRLPLIEVAVSVETAARLRLELDAIRFASADLDDVLVAPAQPEGPVWVAVRLVGTFEVIDPDDEFWLGDRQLVRVFEAGSIERPLLLAAGIIAPEGYRSLLASPGLLRYAWRFMTQPDLVDGAVAGRLGDDLRRLRASFGSASAPRPGERSVRTGLDRILEAFRARHAATVGALTVIGLGVLGVALAALVLVAALVGERRRAALALTRGRGAAAWQAAAGVLAESLLLTLPPTLAGLALATWLVDARPAPLSQAVALGIGLAAAVALLASSLAASIGRLAQTAHVRLAARPVSGRRLVAEGLVIGLALGGVVLLRRRGLAIGAIDPLLAAIPTLLAVATGLILLRAYPLPIRLLAWLAAAGRGLVAPLALRRVSRQPQATQLLLLAALLAVSVGVFASGVSQSVTDGQALAAWRETGADYRVGAPTGGSLGSRLDLAAVAGVDATAQAAVLEGTTVLVTTGTAGATTLAAIEPQRYEAVTAGTPVATTFPAAFGAPPTAQAGAHDTPIPAIISRLAPGGRVRLVEGNRFGLLLDGARVTFLVVGVRDTFAGIAPDQSFVLVPIEHLRARAPQRPVAASVIFLSGSVDALTGIRAAIADSATGAVLESRSARLAALREGPLVGAVSAGF
ncbi:MAG: hypothetical protein ACRDHD_01810, partial [Candidatus Limnocylindria bacterium]